MSSVRDKLWRRLAAGAGVIPACDKQLMYEAKEELEKQAAEIERLRDQHDTYVEMVEQLTRQLDAAAGLDGPRP